MLFGVAMDVVFFFFVFFLFLFAFVVVAIVGLCIAWFNSLAKAYS